MKQIVQSYKSGEVVLREVPVPFCGEKRILVRNKSSLISIGTERTTIELGKKSLIGKAAARPDLVRRALDKSKKEGLLKTWQEAMGRLDTPTPLGYSSAGIVMESGIAATEFSPGDRVACVGQGFASHAEFVSMPINLVCKIPKGVSEDEASFGMLGIIALHGIRSANLTFGSRVVVLGLGLLGLLTVQMLRAYGSDVVAMDPSLDKINLAHKFGLNNVTTNSDELVDLVNYLTMGYGADAVIITAASKERGPIDLAIQLCRNKAKIVVVGTADIHPDRNELWKKEIELIVSKAGGPGALDPLYEIEGVDLPIGEVRWTQKRNLEEFLRLIFEKKIDVFPLITHRYAIEDAQVAYELLISGKLKSPIGVLLEYLQNAPVKRSLPVSHLLSLGKNRAIKDHQLIQIGVIGAGLFGKALLIPALQKIEGIGFSTLCAGSGANVEHSARRFGFSNQTTDSEIIWSDCNIRAVIGLTPHSNHVKLVRDAIKNRKNLFLEKPLCINEDELDKVYEEAQKCYLQQSKTFPIIMVGHNRRHSPHAVRMREWLAFRKSPLILHMRINAGFVPIDHWVHSDGEGRSRIVGEMSHFVDFIQCLVGCSIERVYAEKISGNNRVVVNGDNLAITMKFSDGSVATIVYSGSGDKAYSREYIEIFFDGKTIVSKDFCISELYKNGKVEKLKTSGQQIGYKEELEIFFDYIRNENNSLSGLQDALHIMSTVFAIENSVALGLPQIPRYSFTIL
jgi:threonine dehydrogenase-like Zn-dependent dehydrogenase/predicted dehydrogenase